MEVRSVREQILNVTNVRPDLAPGLIKHTFIERRERAVFPCAAQCFGKAEEEGVFGKKVQFLSFDHGVRSSPSFLT